MRHGTGRQEKAGTSEMDGRGDGRGDLMVGRGHRVMRAAAETTAHVRKQPLGLA